MLLSPQGCPHDFSLAASWMCNQGPLGICRQRARTAPIGVNCVQSANLETGNWSESTRGHGHVVGVFQLPSSFPVAGACSGQIPSGSISTHSSLPPCQGPMRSSALSRERALRSQMPQRLVNNSGTKCERSGPSKPRQLHLTLNGNLCRT
ncbi:hypothetical protein BC628DRAFT_965637 [Trametes gibbosa]|nr:hypothetical protein BC628DRAFT_965637 [Trametes gibbosa]